MAFFEFPHARTYDSDLGWLIESVKQLIDCCNEMTEWKEDSQQLIDDLQKFYDDLTSGRFPDGMVGAFYDWMNQHAIDLIGQLVNNVFFGLTDAGYFVAYIPESWDDITFNTTEYDLIIPTFQKYGHLTLSY